MKHMIFKYVKSIVALFMVFSLIIPNYAALSSSDGSGFITKAEFDSFAAEINSRLTTYESSVNSKIDSQVTSYLDRNGIWNGKKVDITEGNENVLYGVQSGVVTQRNYYNIYRTRLEYAFQKYTKKPILVGNNGDFLLAKNMPKTGLVFIVTKSGARVHGDMRAVVAAVNANEGVNVKNAKWIYEVALSVYAGDWDTRDGIIRNKVSAQFIAGGSPVGIVCPEVPTGTILFFTKKGEDLWYNISQTIDDNSTVQYVDNIPDSLLFWGDRACQTSRTYVFESITIY